MTDASLIGYSGVLFQEIPLTADGSFQSQPLLFHPCKFSDTSSITTAARRALSSLLLSSLLSIFSEVSRSFSVRTMLTCCGWRRGRCPRSCAEYTLGHLPGNYNVMAHCFSRDDCPAPVVNLACVLHVLQEWSLAPMAVTQPAVLVLSGFLCSGTSCVGCCTAGICTYENGCCRRRKWLGPLLCSSLVMV